MSAVRNFPSKCQFISLTLSPSRPPLKDSSTRSVRSSDFSKSRLHLLLRSHSFVHRNRLSTLRNLPLLRTRILSRIKTLRINSSSYTLLQMVITTPIPLFPLHPDRTRPLPLSLTSHHLLRMLSTLAQSLTQFQLRRMVTSASIRTFPTSLHPDLLALFKTSSLTRCTFRPNRR